MFFEAKKVLKKACIDQQGFDSTPSWLVPLERCPMYKVDEMGSMRDTGPSFVTRSLSNLCKVSYRGGNASLQAVNLHIFHLSDLANECSFVACLICLFCCADRDWRT